MQVVVRVVARAKVDCVGNAPRAYSRLYPSKPRAVASATADSMKAPGLVNRVRNVAVLPHPIRGCRRSPHALSCASFSVGNVPITKLPLAATPYPPPKLMSVSRSRYVSICDIASVSEPLCHAQRLGAVADARVQTTTTTRQQKRIFRRVQASIVFTCTRARTLVLLLASTWYVQSWRSSSLVLCPASQLSQTGRQTSIRYE